MRLIWLLVCVALSPAAALAQAPEQRREQAPDCAGVAECITILQTFGIDPPSKQGDHHSRYIDTQMLAKPVSRLAASGEPAVAALVKLLTHANPSVRDRAAYALGYFPKIAPRYLPDLIAAHASVGSWAYDPIAATESGEALQYLWERFMRDARAWESSGVATSLARFGKRLNPLVQAELAKCRNSTESLVCRSVFGLADDLKPLPDFFMPMVEAVARSPDALEEIRTDAEDRLIEARAPYGLTVLTRRLDAALASPRSPGAAGLEINWHDWDAKILVWGIEKYGKASAEAGPLLEKLLARRDMPVARAAAALTVGKIGYREAAPALLSQAGAFEDEWEFAYNAVESLGRLRFEPARRMLHQMAQTHWHKPVRNNAARALSFLDGGEFSVPDDVAGNDGVIVIGSGMEYRYELDREDRQLCRVEGEQAYQQFLADDVRWPDAARGDRAAIGISMQLSPIANPPAAGAIDFRNRYGEVSFGLKLDGGILAGLDAGEFGGSVAYIERSGRHRTLIEDNGVAAFKAGKTAFVFTGLSHMSLSHGTLWLVDIAGEQPELRRRIQLPMNPSGYALASPETLVIQSAHGDVGVRADGSIVDVRVIAACHAS